MNKAKVQEAINNLVLKSRVERQYPASKKQLAELAELGIIDLMPICKHPSVRAIGYTDAAAVLAAAKDGGKRVGGFVDGEGDVVRADASDLYKALHEAEPELEPVDETEEDEDEDDEEEQIEVARYDFDANGEEIIYIVYREGNRYTVDAEWSDGPAWIGDHEPTEAEVEDVHTGWVEETAFQEEQQRIEEDILSQVLTVREVAEMFGVTRDAVHKAIDRNRIPARQSGSTWLIRREDAEYQWGKR